MKIGTTICWTITSLLAFMLLSGRSAEQMRRPENVEGTVLLSYPVYFLSIIGFWKVLGSVALLVPGFPRLKNGHMPAYSSS